MFLFVKDAHGVSSTAIVKEARRRIGSKVWAYDSCWRFPFCKTNKCNTFVASVLNKVDADVPNRSVLLSIKCLQSICGFLTCL